MITAREMLLQRMDQQQTFLCCGLDPDLRRFPAEVFSQAIADEEKVLQFLQQVVDVTAQHVCAYKAQKAFFDLLSDGHNVLKSIVSYIHQRHPGIPVIVDCKVGDIDNTMQVYLDNIFGSIKADGIVVNSYMGEDVIIPCKDFGEKLIVVLVKTSNAGGAVVQDVELQDKRKLWEYILELVTTEWNDSRNMVPVISSTATLDLTKVRQQIPDEMPILLAGVGAQGGSYAELGELLNSQKSGVFVNSSRGILYPPSDPTILWQQVIASKAITLKETLNEQRR